MCVSRSESLEISNICNNVTGIPTLMPQPDFKYISGARQLAGKAGVKTNPAALILGAMRWKQANTDSV